MTQAQKVIRAKVGLLELAKQLGNVSQACKMMGYCSAAVKNLAHNASLHAEEKSAPSKPGTKHLGIRVCPTRSRRWR